MNRTRTVAALALALVLALAGCSGGDDEPTSSAGSDAARHNAADVTFAQDMIPHHRQATEMAGLVAERSTNAQVEQLATQIQQAQEPEIIEMSGWLEDWDEEVPAPDAAVGDMSGMMSPEDLEQLAGLTGEAFDRSFLTLMIAHHEGAIEMARTEAEDGENADAVALARSIEATQNDEIETMRGLLGG
ncbi:DUF305 domain-containing protein [Solicola sp. PLA-1-18]|uniref:DUF305 domain-containing protein n=1 Tax=Solicola sp. PLA-1-18 TaxID=3380532 RepID=UPI003B828383